MDWCHIGLCDEEGGECKSDFLCGTSAGCAPLGFCNLGLCAMAAAAGLKT